MEITLSGWVAAIVAIAFGMAMLAFTIYVCHSLAWAQREVRRTTAAERISVGR